MKLPIVSRGLVLMMASTSAFVNESPYFQLRHLIFGLYLMMGVVSLYDKKVAMVTIAHHINGWVYG
jgi:hypothetical protein